MENLEDWVDEIKLDDLPESTHEIAKVIGIPNTIRLAGIIGGTTLYFPKKDSLIMEARDRRIKKEFRAGRGYKELAIQYDLAETHIRRIIHEDDLERNQITLFPTG